MAGKITQSDFAAKYGEVTGSSVKETLAKPPRTGIIRLPGGIQNGILKLKECYFGRNDKGDFFRVAGTVISPESVGANESLVPVKGLQSSQVVTINADNWNDAKEDIINHMRALVGDSPFKAEKIDLVSIAEMIQQRANDATKKPIYVRFSTEQSKPSAQYPNPRVFENWHGTQGLENYTPAGTGNPAPGLKEAPKVETKQPSMSKDEENRIEAKKEPEKAIEYSDAEDISSLVTRASNDDQEAKDKLSDMAKELGYTDDELEDAESWEVIGDWVRGGKKQASSDEKEKSADFIPEAGNTICQFAPPDKRSKSGGRLKACQCSVEKIDKRSKSMRLKNLEKSDVYYDDVKWNDPNVTYE